MENVLKQEGLEWADKLILVGAVVLFLISTGGLYFSQKATGLDPNAMELGELVTSGKVKRRHARSLHWQSFSGRSKVYLRDIIYTPKDSSAEFRWGGDQVLKLEPDSMVQFDEVTLNRVEIQLIEGKIKRDPHTKGVLVREKQETIRLIPYPKTKGFQFGLPSYDTLKKEIEALDKRLAEVLTNSKLIPFDSKIAKLDVASLSDYTVALLEPAQDKFNVNKNKWLQLKWKPIPLKSVNYQLEMSREETFERFVSHETTESTLAIQFEDPGNYFWRVKATAGNKTITSPVWKFSMVAAGGKETEKMQKKERSISSKQVVYITEVGVDENFHTIIRTKESTKKKCDMRGLRLGNYFCRIKDKTTGKTIEQNAVRIP